MDYASLKSIVATGVGSGPHAPAYSNSGFALFRLILPYLNGYVDADPSQRDAKTSAAYVAYVQQVIWEPLGRTADCKPASVPTLVYPATPGTLQGVDPGDATLVSGGEGWNVSAADLWNFLRALHYSETLLTQAQRKKMYDDKLGWGVGNVSDGDYTSHGGYLWWSVGDKQVASINTVIAIFPSGLIVSLVTNSPVDVGGAITAAYESSRVTK